jgi:hypothetical protein
VAEIEEEMLRNNSKKRKIEKGFKEYVNKEGIEPDETGRYYDPSYGDYVTPTIWAAVIAPQIIHSSTHNVPPPPPGGGHGGGGCACACVACACACACACAGGGAAGCSRKSLHDCEACSDEDASLICLTTKYIYSNKRFSRGIRNGTYRFGGTKEVVTHGPHGKHKVLKNEILPLLVMACGTGQSLYEQQL